MKTRHTVLLTLPLTLVVWACFSWPLPRYAASGMPCSAANVERGHARRMIAGDHLQLLYHFRLAEDMLFGSTPLFNNLYEFNAGDDDARREPGTYYAPFSVVYAVAARIGGQALAWNLTGFLSLWLTLAATAILAQRYCRCPGMALIASLVAISLPYRWFALLGGSPTGFAMALVPVLLLGLDDAVRKDCAGGGAIAGVAILCAFAADLHVFFFSVLLTPCWCLFALLQRTDFAWRKPAAYRRPALALLPAAALAAVAYALSRLVAEELATGVMADGWRLSQVAPYSPRAAGLLAWTSLGIGNQVYIGVLPLVVTVLGGLVLGAAAPWDRPEQRRKLFNWALLVSGAALVIVLALGVHGPFAAAVLRAARGFVPPYRMVRQTAKIFCLLPPLLAVLAAISFDAVLGNGRGRRRVRNALAVLMALLVLEHRCRINATVCLLDDTQEAYRAVAEDAPRGSDPARAVAVPLWPGNSHWTSLNQHYASLYRLRMVNGYRPAVQRAYVDDVFRPLESLNQGVITTNQLAVLRDRDISHLLLHEDAFPAQVSPFPVGVTLRRLLEHPHLEFLRQDERVWAFRIAAGGRGDEPQPLDWPYLFPAQRWEAERLAGAGTDAVALADAGGGGCARLDTPGDACRLHLRAPIGAAPQLRWMLRVRGAGELRCETAIDTDTANVRATSVAGESWTWQDVPFPETPPFFTPSLTVTSVSGQLDLDLVLLAAGPWPPFGLGESRALPAPCFFHAGYTDLQDGSVVLNPDTETVRDVLFGPMLPIDRGRYAVDVRLACDAPAGTYLGWIERSVAGTRTRVMTVAAGKPAHAEFEQTTNLPLELYFSYTRAAPLRLHAIVLTRLAPDRTP